MKIGYARVSTQEQNLALQLAALKGDGCIKIYKEKISGAHSHRPELQKMLDQIRKGDTVVVWKLDRLARSTKGLLETTELFADAGVKFKSISEPWADTTTPGGKMIMTVFAGIAEFERDLIRERTGAGRAAALSRGVKFGRPLSLTDEQKRMAFKLRKEGHSMKEIAAAFGVHVATVYRLGIT